MLVWYYIDMKGKTTSEYALAVAENADRWVPAGGGYEVPLSARNGTRFLYVWNPRTRKHAYLNLDTDIIEEGDPF